MGCAAGLSTAPLTGRELRSVAVPHSLSLSWRLGRAVIAARRAKSDAVKAAAEAAGGTLLFAGKLQNLSFDAASMADLLLTFRDLYMQGPAWALML